MRSSNLKWITFSLFFVLAICIFLFIENFNDSVTTVRKMDEITPSNDLSRQPNSAQIINSSESTKIFEVMQEQSSQIQIPTGASSLEKIIESFEQEKKKASEAALESPFKSLN